MAIEEMTIGDVVYLKAGSPAMTIYQDDGDSVYCRWFNDKKEVQQHIFFKAELTKEDPESIDYDAILPG